mmetsp:Transcript_6131/g.22512  ORF Transcript_6131/g.22512 Transcript_6131/m.22512 type:complete len:234 (+) Transcript_6131:5041-5742(+)
MRHQRPIHAHLQVRKDVVVSPSLGTHLPFLGCTGREGGPTKGVVVLRRQVVLATLYAVVEGRSHIAGHYQARDQRLTLVRVIRIVDSRRLVVKGGQQIIPCCVERARVGSECIPCVGALVKYFARRLRARLGKVRKPNGKLIVKRTLQKLFQETGPLTVTQQVPCHTVANVRVLRRGCRHKAELILTIVLVPLLPRAFNLVLRGPQDILRWIRVIVLVRFDLRVNQQLGYCQK